MKFKLTPIAVPLDDPFRFDALNRKPSVEALSSLIEKLSGPFVLAIDSPWGTGKTTFVQFLMAVLSKKEFKCLYFNAWETDFSSDPMVAFLGELGDLVTKNAESKSGIAKHFQSAKKIATLLATKAIPVAGKIATAGVLDLESFSEKAIANYVSSTLSDAVDEYTAQRDLIKQFRTSLSGAMEKLTEDGQRKQVVIFVDELDRCRPTYAVELLERIKHLFDIENIIFVVSLDKQQLHVSLSAVYGDGINSDEYLRRFIDLEYLLPKPDSGAFNKNLFKRFGFDEFFDPRTQTEFQDDKGNLLNTLESMSEIFNLSLRAREQCFTRIRIAMLVTTENYFLFPHLLATLAALKAGAPHIYRWYAFGDGEAKEVVDYLREQPGGEEMLETHFGAVIEAYLVAAKSSRFDESGGAHEYKKLSEDETRSEDERKRADKIVRLLSHMSMRDRAPPLSYVVSKLELASQFDN